MILQNVYLPPLPLPPLPPAPRLNHIPPVPARTHLHRPLRMTRVEWREGEPRPDKSKAIRQTMIAISGRRSKSISGGLVAVSQTRPSPPQTVLVLPLILVLPPRLPLRLPPPLLRTPAMVTLQMRTRVMGGGRRRQRTAHQPVPRAPLGPLRALPSQARRCPLLPQSSTDTTSSRRSQCTTASLTMRMISCRRRVRASATQPTSSTQTPVKLRWR